MLMVDTVQIHLPFFAKYCHRDEFVKTKYHLSLDLPAIDYNLRIHAKMSLNKMARLYGLIIITHTIAYRHHTQALVLS